MKQSHGGIIFEQIVPGDFYRSNSPGGWTDRTTGIHIPGPVVNVSGDGSRMIEGIASMPDPIQLPHYKMVVEFKDKDRKIQEKKEVPFDRQDEMPLHDGLSQALGTGIIERVPNEEVEEYYPEAWANRKDKIVFDAEVKVSRPIRDMISEYHKNRKVADQAAVDEAQKVLKTPPPPPVPVGKK